MNKKIIYIMNDQHKSLKVLAAEHGVTLQDAIWNVLKWGLDHMHYCDPITPEQKRKINHSEAMWKMVEDVMEEAK